mmetsp:Transcript_12039/g.38093  ORF Transcript_12039/g.38093 Transcript_12039/m.38093 type:complete len:297 (-) Transcript_12039:100-990(-)
MLLTRSIFTPTSAVAVATRARNAPTAWASIFTFHGSATHGSPGPEWPTRTAPCFEPPRLRRARSRRRLRYCATESERRGLRARSMPPERASSTPRALPCLRERRRLGERARPIPTRAGRRAAHRAYSEIVMPMFLAVPATIFIAASMFFVLRSGILTLAISSSCAFVIEPTLSLCGCAEPFCTPAALLMSTDAGGVFRTKVNERSSYTVISAGMIMPGWSDVRALYSLQNITMFTPAEPSAGPTGGAGLALPAGSASLMMRVTFLPPMSTSQRETAGRCTRERASGAPADSHAPAG